MQLDKVSLYFKSKYLYLLLIPLGIFIHPILGPIAIFFSLILCNGIYNSRNNWSLLNVLYLIIFLVLLTPGIKIISDFPAIRPEEYIIYIGLPLYLIINAKHVFVFEKYTIIIFLIIFSILISIFYGKYFLNVPVGFNDYFEVLKWIKLLILFYFIRTLNLNTEKIHLLFKFTLLLIGVSLLMGILQYYSIFGFDDLTVAIYSDRVYYANTRMLGTYSNPNDLAYSLGVGALLATSFFLYEKKMYYLVISFLFLFGILLTGSRTGLGATFISLMSLFLFSEISLKKKLLMILVSITFMTILFLNIDSFMSAKVSFRFASGANLAKDESWLLRLYAWFLNLKIYVLSPIVGWGPAKNFHPLDVDSEYILALRRYGIVGFLLLVSFYIFLFREGFKKSKFIRIFAPGLLTAVCLTGVSNTVLGSIQTMDYMGILYALIVIASTQSEKKSNAYISPNLSNSQN